MLFTIPQPGDEVVFENWLGGSYTPARVVSVSSFPFHGRSGGAEVEEVSVAVIEATIEATIEAVGFEPTGVTITVPIECIEYLADYQPPAGFVQLVGDFGAS